jgi:CBS domain-containing protein
MKVVDIMTKPAIAVDADTPVDAVAKLLSEQRLSGVPVLGRAGEILGIVTEEDLIVRNANLHLPTFLNFLDGLFPVRGQHEFDQEVRRMLATSASEVMSENLYVVSPDDDVSDVASLMIEKHANPLPVMRDGKLVGMISRADIIRLMVSEESAASSTLE